jgi:hypothetical protein
MKHGTYIPDYFKQAFHDRTKKNNGFYRRREGEDHGSTWSLPVLGIGKGPSVFMDQILKPPDSSGEHLPAQALALMLIMKPTVRKGFIGKRMCGPLDTFMTDSWRPTEKLLRRDAPGNGLEPGLSRGFHNCVTYSATTQSGFALLRSAP